MPSLTGTKNFVKRWVRGWRLVILIIILLIAGLVFRGIYAAKHDTSSILTDTVKKQDLKQTVLATGVVTSSTDLNLSFRASGTVKKVNVKVGSKVSVDQILATLDQKDQSASLTSARGALAAAQANYDKVVSGASSEDVAVAQASLDAAKAAQIATQNQQQVAVANALSAMMNSTLSVTPGSGNQNTGSIAVSGTYNSTESGQYKINVYSAGDGAHFSVSGLESFSGLLYANSPIAIGTRGLYIQLTGMANTSDYWTIDVPNTKAANYLTNYNAYQSAKQTQASALSSAQSAVDQAQATLNLKKAQARPADIQAAEAQILSAQGQYQAANAALENTIIRAPVAGTVTRVDIHVGQTASSLAPAVVVQDVGELHLEADVSEANVAQIQAGQSVDVTFDAIGPDQHYLARVTNLDLSSTVVSGVVNYKLTASLDKTEGVLPGMTANMTILSKQESSVLAVPSRAILSHDGKKFVRVITDSKTKKYQEQEVITGFEADGGLTEITSGLNVGDEFVTLLK